MKAHDAGNRDTEDNRVIVGFILGNTPQAGTDVGLWKVYDGAAP